MDVSIIIVNYNTKQITQNCINSVFEKTLGITFEVILIDNASIDGSKEVFENDTRIRFIESGSNIGFGRANNLGIEIAQGRNIIFLNPDTQLINNAIKLLSDYLDNHPTVGACGGNLYNENLQPITSFHRFFPGLEAEINELTGNRYSRIRYRSNYDHNFTDKPFKVAFVSGADMMVRKEIINEIGIFDPEFFLFHEETELSYRITKAGYTIFSIPNSRIIHFVSKSFAHNEIKTKELYRSRQIFYHKIYSKNKVKILNTLFIFHYKFRAFLAIILRQSEIYKYNKQILKIFKEAKEISIMDES
jgi:GT2 family glycosyltransferase